MKTPAFILTTLTFLFASPCLAVCDPPLSLDTENIYDLQLSAWLTIIRNSHEDGVYKKDVATTMSAYVFEFWLLDKNAHTVFLDPGVIHDVIHLASYFHLDPQDPLSLNKCYDGDELNWIGRTRLNVLPLRGGAKLLANRQVYLKYVTDYNIWVKAILDAREKGKEKH